MAKIKLIGVVLLLLCCSAPRPAWRCEEQPALYREGAEVLVVDDLTVRTYRWPIWATVKGQRHGAWRAAPRCLGGSAGGERPRDRSAAGARGGVAEVPAGVAGGEHMSGTMLFGSVAGRLRGTANDTLHRRCPSGWPGAPDLVPVHLPPRVWRALSDEMRPPWPRQPREDGEIVVRFSGGALLCRPSVRIRSAPIGWGRTTGVLSLNGTAGPATPQARMKAGGGS